jgi:hypothetical protein
MPAADPATFFLHFAYARRTGIARLVTGRLRRTGSAGNAGLYRVAGRLRRRPEGTRPTPGQHQANTCGFAETSIEPNHY